ncbi:hypothetical protein ABZ234_03400 [Nocardiopsis sp. NPDC006198]|uniref:hypothetical protein n=1 Tax=Nocardiopsis sp. NPDC006198 TaxID=3154472 RepID=UPI0033B9C25C
MITTTAAEYIRTVETAIRHSENSWAWDHKPHIPEDELETSDAAMALAAYLEAAEEGRGGIISLPDGQAVAWHHRDGWSVISEHGVATGLLVGLDATGAEVARIVAKY